MSIDFRFPGGRWERCPIQDPAAALVLMGQNYDLRVDGEVIVALSNDAPESEVSR